MKAYRVLMFTYFHSIFIYWYLDWYLFEYKRIIQILTSSLYWLTEAQLGGGRGSWWWAAYQSFLDIWLFGGPKMHHLRVLFQKIFWGQSFLNIWPFGGLKCTTYECYFKKISGEQSFLNIWLFGGLKMHHLRVQFQKIFWG